MRDSRSVLLGVASALACAAVLADARGAAAQGAAPLTLAQAVSIATRQAAAVGVAGLRADEADARVGQARGALLPALTGTASASNRTYNLQSFGFAFPSIPGAAPFPDLVGPVDVVDARLRVTQTLFDASSWMRVSTARHGAEQAGFDRDAAVEGAAQGAAIAYLHAARARAVLEAREADERIASELSDVARAQLEAGTSPAIDATRARTQLAAATGARLVARSQLDRALIELSRALGADPSAEVAVADTLSERLGASDAPDDSAAALARALELRPELRSERARLSRARSERGAISAERLPRVEASADWGVSGRTGPDAIPTREVAVALTLPILDGFRREARLGEQNAIARESEIRERDAREQVVADVRAARLDLASGRGQLGVALERLSLAEEELEQARERFVQGIASNVEVINAQSSLNRARDAAIDARFAIAAARVAVARATGVARTLR